jgi:hypothetical protein
MGLFLSALTCVRENQSFAPPGLVGLRLLPAGYAVGCILTPLRGSKLAVLFHRVIEILVRPGPRGFRRLPTTQSLTERLN